MDMATDVKRHEGKIEKCLLKKCGHESAASQNEIGSHQIPTVTCEVICWQSISHWFAETPKRKKPTWNKIDNNNETQTLTTAHASRGSQSVRPIIKTRS